MISPEALQSFIVLALGFAVAGLVANFYQAMAHRPASFALLGTGPGMSAFAAVPLLVFAAPFIIMRNTIRARRKHGRRFEFVVMATVLAGFWSLMSGTFVVALLQAAGIIAG